ncbi:hypothetical protein LCGC14_0164960 [marine sediment metagenome]|uniref:Uncharacterized protein n=1 Tax=marine sediment metagenome TaxID=412755 RepID=A0A0F9VAS6_9ZZZZ
MPKFGRNSPCHCGSGKKFKKCCLGKPPESDPKETPEDRSESLRRSAQAMRRLEAGNGLLAAFSAMNTQRDRRLQEYRHEEFLRSEFKRLGKSDEEIDRMFPKRR